MPTYFQTLHLLSLKRKRADSVEHLASKAPESLRLLPAHQTVEQSQLHRPPLHPTPRLCEHETLGREVQGQGN